MKRIPVGIQLYTVREDCKNDLKGTLTALAAMGYKGVEFAGVYGGMEPQPLADFLAGLKLACCGLHVSVDDIINPDSKSYAYATALKSPYLTTSMAGRVAKDWPVAIEQARKAGETAAARGITFTYHNHAQEFALIDGEYALDVFYAQTDPKTVKAELDTFWIKKGGADPAPYIRKYAGRVPQVHLKDMDPADETFTEVGAGLMNLPAIFAAAATAGAQWIIYEQDTCKGSALASARASIDNIRRNSLL